MINMEDNHKTRRLARAPKLEPQSPGGSTGLNQGVSVPIPRLVWTMPILWITRITCTCWVIWIKVIICFIKRSPTYRVLDLTSNIDGFLLKHKSYSDSYQYRSIHNSLHLIINSEHFSRPIVKSGNHLLSIVVPTAINIYALFARRI